MALLGLCYIADEAPRALYSKAQIYARLESIGMTDSELMDYYNWHFVGYRAGEFTPVILDDLSE